MCKSFFLRLQYQSRGLPFKSSLVFFFSSRLSSRAYASGVFCFLPSPLHLSGVNCWDVMRYGWRLHLFVITGNLGVSVLFIVRYGWRLHPPWCSPFPSPDEGAHERNWFLCGMMMEKVKSGWRKNERWSLHLYLFDIQCVWWVCCDILRRVAFTPHLVALQSVIPERWRSEGWKTKNGGRAHARGMSVFYPSFYERMGRAKTKKRALPREGVPAM